MEYGLIQLPATRRLAGVSKIHNPEYYITSTPQPHRRLLLLNGKILELIARNIIALLSKWEKHLLAVEDSFCDEKAKEQKDQEEFTNSKEDWPVL